MTATTATLSGTFVSGDGSPASGELYIAPDPSDSNAQPGRVVTNLPVWVRLDETGSFSLELTPSDDPDWYQPNGVPYRVTERLRAVDNPDPYLIWLPTGGADLIELRPVQDPPADQPAGPGKLPPSGGTSDHGQLLGLDDDDHGQYLTSQRHSLEDHSHTHPVPAHADLTGLDADDHGQYLTSQRHSLEDHSHTHSLDQLTDVATADQRTGSVLTYDTESGVWAPEFPSSALGMVSFDYRFSTDLAAVASGRVGIDTADPAAATVMRISRFNQSGDDLTTFLDEIVPGGWLNVHDRDDANHAIRYDVDGVPTVDGDTYTVPVVPFDQLGAPLTDNLRVSLVVRYSLGFDADARYVNTSGDTMAGPLTLAGDPTADLHAATKAYVDQNAGTPGPAHTWTARFTANTAAPLPAGETGHNSITSASWWSGTDEDGNDTRAYLNGLNGRYVRVTDGVTSIDSTGPVSVQDVPDYMVIDWDATLNWSALTAAFPDGTAGIWVEEYTPAGVPEAPQDGGTYGRQNAAWAPAVANQGGASGLQVVTESEWAGIDPGTAGVVYIIEADPAKEAPVEALPVARHGV